MMAHVRFMVKRIPSTGYQEESYWIGMGVTEQGIRDALHNDKNVLDYYKIF